MGEFTRKKCWWMVGLAFVALLVVQVGGPFAESGREFPLCMQSCNETRKACTDACKADCDAIYPDDQAAQNLCTDTCKDICIENSKECKQVCMNIKDPPSPEEP